ncbi:MAG TPA: metallophosphoesterase family protein [Byssovorax sp.]|jgi:hypothetical protein
MPRAALAKSRATIELPVDGRARIAVVADTHGAPHPRAEELVRELAPIAILHAGDIGGGDVLTRLAAIAPLYAVRGNIDPRAAETPDAWTVDVTRAGAVVLRVLVFHIAVAGPRLRADAARLARAEGANLVVCGHSHVPFVGRDHGLVVFNPGSIGPRRFHLPIVLGVVDVTEQGVSFGHVDCETGAPWSPPEAPRASP